MGPRCVSCKLISAQESRSEAVGRGVVVGRKRLVDPLETEPWATELWKLEAWREALEEVWKGRRGWGIKGRDENGLRKAIQRRHVVFSVVVAGVEPASETAAASAVHARAWQLATKLLQERFWSGNLDPGQSELLRHHEDMWEAF